MDNFYCDLYIDWLVDTIGEFPSNHYTVSGKYLVTTDSVMLKAQKIDSESTSFFTPNWTYKVKDGLFDSNHFQVVGTNETRRTEQIADVLKLVDDAKDWKSWLSPSGSGSFTVQRLGRMHTIQIEKQFYDMTHIAKLGCGDWEYAEIENGELHMPIAFRNVEDERIAMIMPVNFRK